VGNWYTQKREVYEEEEEEEEEFLLFYDTPSVFGYAVDAELCFSSPLDGKSASTPLLGLRIRPRLESATMLYRYRRLLSRGRLRFLANSHLDRCCNNNFETTSIMMASSTTVAEHRHISR